MVDLPIGGDKMEKPYEKGFRRLFRKRDNKESVWTMIEMTALNELIEQNRLDEAKGFILSKKLSAVRTIFNVTWK